MIPSYYKPKTPYFDHQKHYLDNFWERKYYALFWEMGLGKTKAIIDNIAILRGDHLIDRVLVIAPKSVYHNWVGEFEKHYPNPDDIVVCAYGENSQFRKDFKSMLSQDKKLQVFLVNVEGMAYKAGSITDLFIAGSGNVMTVVDESSFIKDHKTKRSKKVAEIGKKSMYRRCLTGTPMTASPTDLWGQCKFLGKGITTHQTLASFKARYLEIEVQQYGPGRAYPKVVGYRNLEELSQICTIWSDARRKEDCLDLPDKLYMRREVELVGNQKTMYQSIARDHLFQMGEELIEAPNAMSLFQKLSQIVCGQLKMEDGKYMTVDSKRMDVMREIIDELPDDEKVIVWCSFKEMQDVIHTYLCLHFNQSNVSGVFAHMNADQRQKEIDKFKTSGRFLVSNPAVAGFGLTLTECKYAIYFNNSFKLEPRLQSEDRMHRIGQEHNVTYIDLYSPGTIEDRIMEIIESKKELAQTVFTKQEIMDIITLKG